MTTSESLWGGAAESFFPPPVPPPMDHSLDFLLMTFRSCNLIFVFVAKLLASASILFLLRAGIVVSEKLTHYTVVKVLDPLFHQEMTRAVNSDTASKLSYYFRCADVMIMWLLAILALTALYIYCAMFLTIKSFVYLKTIWGLNSIPG